MRQLFQFFSTKAGILTLIVVGILVVMWSVNSSSNKRSLAPSSGDKRELVLSSSAEDKLDQKEDSVLKNKRTPFVVPKIKVPRLSKKTLEKEKEVASAARAKPVKISSMNIFTSRAKIKKPLNLASGILPYGQLLRCSTVNALDSAISATPIIALVTHDLYFKGEKLVAAGTQIHGSISGSRNGRITSDNSWAVVMLDGRELVFKGMALDRSELRGNHNQAINWGLMDGAAGIQGKSIESQDFNDIRLFAASFISGLARGSQTTQSSIYGPVAVGGIGNGMKEGLSEVLDKYAERIEKQIRETGRYVFVSPGKEFYVYNLETVDFRKSKTGATTFDEPVSAARSSTGSKSPSGAGSQFQTQQQ